MVYDGALIYPRKSTIDVEQRSLEQQETACRDLAARLGLPVKYVMVEQASAYADRERPVFTKALQVAAAERLVILTWAIDRFSRKGAEAVLPMLKADSPLRLVTVEGDDTADERQRLIIIIKAEMALQYSRQLGRNVRRARAAARDAGLWAGGTAPYGYQIEGAGRTRHLVVDEAEAAVVRDIAARVLANEPVGRIATDLNRRGIPGPTGKPWWHSTVKRMLTTPALAGWLPRGGDMLRDTSGRPVEAHEPILPPDVWERLQPLVRYRKLPGGRPPKYLLSGLLRCPCGGSMGGGGIRYLCPAPRTPGATHAAINMDDADAAIVDMVLGRIVWLGTLDEADPRVLAVAAAWGSVHGADDARGERVRRQDDLDTARARLQRLLRLVSEGTAEEADAGTLLAEYRQAVRTAEARLDELGATKVDVAGLLDLTRPQWAALPIDRQRAVLWAILDAVDLRPGRMPADRRLRPRWVGEKKEPPA